MTDHGNLPDTTDLSPEALDIVLRNPTGPWTLEELEVLTPSVINSGA